jgi:AcrR family transcriptional regulator
MIDASVRPGDSGVPREQVAAIQRSRLLAAALGEMDERGYAATTVAHITDRSRVSRRTFYELFANREECLAAVLDKAVAAIERDLADADLGGLAWRERVRGGLWTILWFFDREPALARVCVVQALAAGGEVLARREAILARLAAVVDEGRSEGARGAQCGALTAEGVVGAALAIVYARLLRRDPTPLRDLLGELVGMIVLPYLGKAAARREQLRAAPSLPERTTRSEHDATPSAGDPLMGVPMRLTYRTARVLEGVGEHPGASNRQLADYAGIADQGQVSKLLARLQRLGLLENRGDPARTKGEPNAWTLTSKGQQITQSISTHDTHRQAA